MSHETLVDRPVKRQTGGAAQEGKQETRKMAVITLDGGHDVGRMDRDVQKVSRAGLKGGRLAGEPGGARQTEDC